MKKLKIAIHFIKIKLHNIGTLLIKTATGYVVGSFALIQVTSIVTDNISTVNIMGLAKESFMQYLFIGLLALFPILMVVTYFIKRQSIDEKGLANINKNFETFYAIPQNNNFK